MTDYLILSPKWTHYDDPYITFWRPNNAGYAWALEWSGRYDEVLIASHASYYNNADSTIAVPVDVAITLAESATIDRKEVTAVKNTPRNLNILKGAVYRRGEVSC